MSDQPTMEGLRRIRDDRDLRERIVESIALRDAQNMGFPTIDDADVPMSHRLFAQRCVDEMFRLAGLPRPELLPEVDTPRDRVKEQIGALDKSRKENPKSDIGGWYALDGAGYIHACIKEDDLFEIAYNRDAPNKDT